MINETRFQPYHTNSDQMANFDLATINVAVSSFNGGGSQLGHSIDTENHYELQNYTTIAGGVHSWKFGIRVRAVTIDNISPANFNGTLLVLRRLRSDSGREFPADCAGRCV